MIAPYNRISSNFAYFLVFIAFLMSSRCWIGFEGRNTLFFYCLPIVLFMLISIGAYKIRNQSKYVMFAFLIYIANVYTMHRARGTFEIIGMANQAVLPITTYLLLCLQDSKKELLLYHITKWFGMILIPGMIIYICSFFVNLPSLGIIQTHYGGDFYGEPCYNYLFYLKPITVGATGMFRFNGPLIEPGDLGCVSAFLLYATKFDFKRFKYLWAVLASLILTFSLAGYLLALFGYSAIMMTKNKFSSKKLLLGVLVFSTVIAFGTYYNGGDNYINHSILSRLQDDELAIDNTNGRISTQKLEFFYFMFENPSVLWLGYDKATISFINEQFGAGAGFYNQVLNIGILGIILYLLPYFYITFKSRDRRYALLSLVFLILYAYQRFDLFWISLILCYTFGICLNDKEFELCKK